MKLDTAEKLTEFIDRHNVATEGLGDLPPGLLRPETEAFLYKASKAVRSRYPFVTKEVIESIYAKTGLLREEDARNDTSQFGEDGLIEAALDSIGIENKWCFEVGAGDGIRLSNTHTLRGEGWSAVLIEASDKLYAELEKHEAGSVRTVHEKIGPQSLDRILFKAGAPVDMDLGVIDIDGQDFWVWVGMQVYQPRLMLVEFSPYHKDDVLPRLNCPFPAPVGMGQAGIERILDLGEAKGYVPLACTQVNLLFARKDCL